MPEQQWTGLVCPYCDKAVAIISNRLPGFVVGFCAACGHRWMAEEPDIDRRRRFDYVRDDARCRIDVTAHQPLDGHDLIAIVDRQLRENTWAYATLYDFRGHEWTHRHEAIEVAEHVETYVEIHGPRGPVAICARTMDIVVGGQQNAFAGADRVVVFTDRAKAELWLDEQQAAS
jgi:hypothetical protein